MNCMELKKDSEKPVKKLNNRALKAEEVCSILKACYESRVRVLKFSNLEVEFLEDVKPQIVVSEPILPDTAMSEDKPDAPDLFRVETESLIEREAADVKQMQLDQMLIEDPLQYEHLLLAGELEDAKSGDQGAE